MARTEQIRHQLFLPRPVSDRLEALAAKPGVSRSKILADALTAWLNRKGADEMELRFAARLDRLSSQLGRIERDGHVQLESLALFVRYMLTVNAPLPEGDDAARAVGQDRFEAFIQRVARQLAGGKLTLLPEDRP